MALQSQLISDCKTLLHEEDLNVYAFIMMVYTQIRTLLGYWDANLQLVILKHWFQKLKVPTQTVHILFYACHILKFMWNLLADYRDITFIQNGQRCNVHSNFVDRMNVVQEFLGFRLGMKLKKKHIAWEKQKMNISRDVKTLG